MKREKKKKQMINNEKTITRGQTTRRTKVKRMRGRRKEEIKKMDMRDGKKKETLIQLGMTREKERQRERERERERVLSCFHLPYP